MARRRDIPWGLWLGCLAAALLAHAALIVPGGRALARSLSKGVEPRASERAAFDLELIEQPEENEPLQFVALEQANGLRPLDAERVAALDSDVEHESSAPPAPRTTSTPRSSAAQPTPEPAEPQPEPTQSAEPSDLVPAEDGQIAGAEPTPTAPITPAEQRRLLTGSTQVLHDNFAAPLPPASVAKAERGRESLLDSRTHPYASFYARMHERILAHYDCEAAIERHDPRRTQLGDQQRSTILRVQLDRSGAIERLSFVQDSGVEYLDAEAVRTIRAAGPFPNPPEGLFDESGALVVRVAFEVNPDGSARIHPRSN